MSEALQQPAERERIVELITTLRTQPEPADWPVVAQAAGVTRPQLNRYRWLIAAQLHAEGQGWTEIAGNPAVAYNEATVRKRHERATLPGGLSWGEYVAAYREALRERALTLQREKGEQAAETIHQVAVEALSEIKEHQRALKAYRENALAVGYPTLDFGEGYQLPHPKVTGLLLGLQHALLQALEKAQRVLSGIPAEADSQEDAALDVERNIEELTEILDEGRRLDAELAGYLSPGEAANA